MLTSVGLNRVENVRVQTWMFGGVSRARKRLRVIVCSVVHVITQRAAPHQCKIIRYVLLPIADLEDGELQKMLTSSPLYAKKASGRPDAMVVQEREVSAQYTQADRKDNLQVSFI